MHFNKSSRPSIPASHNNDLYSIDQSLLNFSRNYEPKKTVSCGHSDSESRSVSVFSPKTCTGINVAEKK